MYYIRDVTRCCARALEYYGNFNGVGMCMSICNSLKRTVN